MLFVIISRGVNFFENGYPQRVLYLLYHLAKIYEPSIDLLREGEAMVLLKQDTDMSDTTRVIKLMKCVIRSGAYTYAALNDLYVELKINGGFLRGRRMAPATDQRTREELVGYVTALVVVLVRRELNQPDEAKSLVPLLEELVFQPDWHAARPAYQRYLARYLDASAGESLVTPRHKVLLILFRQALMDIWSVPPELFTEERSLQRYCEALTALQDRLEHLILVAIQDSR
jgi:hypothetical protein